MTRHVTPSDDEPSGNAEVLNQRFDAIDRSLSRLNASGQRHPFLRRDFCPMKLAAWREQHDAIREEVRQAHAALAAPLDYKPPKHTRRLIEVGKSEQIDLLNWLVALTTRREFNHRRPELHAAKNPLGIDPDDVMALWMKHMPERVLDHGAKVNEYRRQQREREQTQRKLRDFQRLKEQESKDACAEQTT